MLSYGIEASVADILSKAGIQNVDFQLEPLNAGGNNRVFTVHSGSTKVVLKWYFHDDSDTRDRLGSEYSFLNHAWSLGLRCIPQPIAKDHIKHLALYEFVEGQKIEASQVDVNLVQQAANFFAQLNSQKSRDTASALPIASEACFSVSMHFSMVEARLERLAQMPIESELDKEAAVFVKSLKKFWQETKAQLLIGCESLGIAPDVVLPNDGRCLSPSDFGFHNSLLRPDGSVCFIDFEYAGWDDPAKAIGDFFSHPGVAVPHLEFEPFMAQVLKPFDRAKQMAARVRLLEPISRIKWCCIIMNEFLPDSARRRNFANPSADTQSRKRRQLIKAIQLFQTLQH